MANEVRVTTSQADAAKMIVERNSANGKPSPEAIRKISEAQVDPAPEPDNRRQPRVAVSGRTKGRLRSFLARLFLGKVATEAAGVKIRTATRSEVALFLVV
jgi:hypothetical protein